MTATRRDYQAERILVLMPTRADAERTVQLLRDVQTPSTICADLADVCQEIRLGAGALLLTAETLLGDSAGQLAEAVRAQPAWSALPVLVVARESAVPHLQRASTDAFRSLTIVERPVRVQTLLGMVASALRTRRHQYQIRDAMQELDRRAAELVARDAELARQAAQLRNNDRLKDDFLATLAHELRNPLAPIRTGLDLLSAQPSSAPVSRTLSVMQRQLQHMVRLIDDLLDVSRITQGKLELKRESITLSDAVEVALEASKPSIERGLHTLQVSLADEPLPLHADLTRVAQIISNLLSNASKYTPSGGTITLSTERAGGDAVLTVTDSGIGIPQDRLEDVFVMFSQVTGTLDPGEGGLGIGLALVRRLVEMHGGTVTATSAGVGRGSTFQVRLPLAAARTVTSAPTEQSAALTPRGMRILIVDDNDDAAELLALTLEHAGHHTSVEHDGPAAIARANVCLPEIVFLDIGLPGMSGYEVARQLRSDPRFARIAIIALTGWGTLEDKRKALEAGFDMHLTKPIDARALQDSLSKLATAPGVV
ncbi:MAG: ATP-binding protein [Polyangiales bacterium]